MSYAEFRQWAWERFGYRFRNEPQRIDSVWRTVWGDSRYGRAGTKGYDADYTVVQQRRFAVWVRSRGLLARGHLGRWLAASESHDGGWLVNDGSGIRWIEHPETEVHELIQRGFVAVKCGL